MTTDELAALLLKHPGLPVILSRDAEGNYFSPLAPEPDGDLDVAMYDADSTYHGERYMTDEQRDDTGEPDEYSEAPDTALPAVFLWPTN